MCEGGKILGLQHTILTNSELLFSHKRSNSTEIHKIEPYMNILLCNSNSKVNYTGSKFLPTS